MPTLSELEALTRGILDEAGTTSEFTQEQMFLALDYAQLELAKATRLTMKKEFLWGSRRVELPASVIDLDTVYTGMPGGGDVV